MNIYLGGTPILLWKGATGASPLWTPLSSPAPFGRINGPKGVGQFQPSPGAGGWDNPVGVGWHQRQILNWSHVVGYRLVWYIVLRTGKWRWKKT